MIELSLWQWIGLICLFLGTVGAVYWYKIAKTIPMLRVLNKNTLFIGGILICLVSFGVFGMFQNNPGSLSRGSAVQIYQTQITTDFATDISGTVTNDVVNKRLVHVRLTDAQANETDTHEELTTGVIKVYRKGDTKPMSCPIVVTSPNYKGQTTSTKDNGVTYNILEKNTAGEVEAYIKSCGGSSPSSSCAAATTDAREKSTISFGDGVDYAYVGLMLEVSEAGHDALNQYESKFVDLNICGAVIQFEIERMD